MNVRIKQDGWVWNWLPGWLPGHKWLRIVSQLLQNLNSPDGSVKIIYSATGVAFQVNSEWLRTTAASNGLALAKITSWTSPGSGIVTATIYGNGIGQTATATGKTVKLSNNPDRNPGANNAYAFVRSTPGESYEYEAAWQPVSDNDVIIVDDIILSDPGGGDRILTAGKNYLSLNYSTGGQLQPSKDNQANNTSVIQFDCTTEIDLAPQLQISGGNLQVRIKKVKLKVTSDTLPKLQLEASSTYGSWVDGPDAEACTT